MSSREKVLAIRRIQKEREEIAISIEVFEGERWDGFLGGIKGILTCIISSIIFILILGFIGNLANIEILTQLDLFLGFSTGLVFSQCVRNKKNEKLYKEIQVLKNKYNKLARTTKEIIYA